MQLLKREHRNAVLEAFRRMGPFSNVACPALDFACKYGPMHMQPAVSD